MEREPDNLDQVEMNEWEREAIERADRRMRSVRDEEHRFSSRPRIADRFIRGTWFSCYDNSLSEQERGEDNLPERYRWIPILIYSERNRFAQLCDLAMLSWLAELPQVLDVIEILERGEGDEETEWTAESFGLDVTPDCYRIGFWTGAGSSTPIFAAKDLVLGLIDLMMQSLILVEGERGLPDYDPRALLVRIEEIQRRALSTENDENA